jgi:hypothetical protein
MVMELFLFTPVGVTSDSGGTVSEEVLLEMTWIPLVNTNLAKRHYDPLKLANQESYYI